MFAGGFQVLKGHNPGDEKDLMTLSIGVVSSERHEVRPASVEVTRLAALAFLYHDGAGLSEMVIRARL